MQNKHTMLLLNTDSAAGVSEDPFAGLDLGDPKLTNFPIIRNGNYSFILRDVLPMIDKDDSTKQKGIVGKLELNEDGALDTNGNALHKGWKSTFRIYGISGKRTKDAVARDCSFLVKSALGLDGAKGVNLSEFWKTPGKFIDGKVVDVKAKVRPPSTNKDTGQQYDEQNEFSFIPPGQ